MTRTSGGPTTDQGEASKPDREERDREFAGIAGNAAQKGEEPSPGDRDRGETSTADGDAPAIDFDSAHDRAS